MFWGYTFDFTNKWNIWINSHNLFSDQDSNAGDEKPLVRLIKQERAYLTFTRVTKGIHHKLPQITINPRLEVDFVLF